MKEALKLADRGLAVFPCGPDKRPLTTHGYKDASSDPAQIKEWWREHPNALIGVPAGDKFVVIEINDNPNIDAGYEDSVLKDNFYTRLIDVFVRRLEARTDRNARV